MNSTADYKPEEKYAFHSSVRQEIFKSRNQQGMSSPRSNVYDSQRGPRPGNFNTVAYYEPGRVQNAQSSNIQPVQSRGYIENQQIQSGQFQEGKQIYTSRPSYSNIPTSPRLNQVRGSISNGHKATYEQQMNQEPSIDYKLMSSGN